MQNQHNKNVLFKGNTVQNAGYYNNDFVFVLINGENENVVFEENKLIRTDMNLNPYLFSVASPGGVSLLNNKLENGKIWLRSTSSNIVVSGNNAEVTDQGTNNIITN